MEPAIVVVWRIGESFFHRLLVETYLRARRGGFFASRMRHILAGPLPPYARALLTAPPSLADAMREPRIGPVLPCDCEVFTPDPVPPIPEPPVTTEHRDLALFLAGAALLLFVAYRVHQHRRETDDAPPEATVASTDPVDPPAADIAHDDASDFWFAFVIVVFAILTIG